MRQRAYLRRRYRAILAYTALIHALCGAWMLAPIAAVAERPEESRWIPAFLVPGLALAVLGVAAWRRLRVPEVELSLHEGGVIVLSSWVGACLASAVPLVWVEGLGPTQAIFESVSGWTTTGLSVVDPGAAQRVTLLWRSSMQLAGGAGLAILMLAALAGPTGPTVGAAEGRSDQLVPNVRHSARLVLRIYGSFVACGVLAYRVAGMDWFEAVNHSFAALSTGGFSTRPESIGAFRSTAIESVTLVLMLLGNLSFVTAWLLLRGRWRAVAANAEVRVVALLVPAAATLLLLLTCGPLYGSFGEAARVSIFESVTALTTTGFSTVSYEGWNPFGVFVLVVLMLLGGGTCSTAGGIKQYRVYVVYRALLRELGRPFRPRGAVLQPSFDSGGRRVRLDDAAVRAVAVFAFLYLATLTLGTGALAAHGYPLEDALFEFASALGTVGLSVGVTRADAPAGVLWVEIAGMLLGRLEFFVVLVAAAKLARDATWLFRKDPG